VGVVRGVHAVAGTVRESLFLEGGMTESKDRKLLPEAVLARRSHLPLKPNPVSLDGIHVRLAPLDLLRDANALFAVANGQPARLGDRHIGAYDADALIWRYMSGGPFSSAGELAEWLRGPLEGPNSLTLCVLDVPTGLPIGVVNYLNNSPTDLKLELGSIWYSPLVQRTAANTEATYLLLQHAFGLGYRRVEWKCDVLNQRSRLAALRMGFQFEGIQEYHYIVKGFSRDTAWYRILDREWPQVQAHLERLLTTASRPSTF
jgi:RimJ/RimL family protein N-acetyltransferase